MRVSLKVSGMSCVNCAKAIEISLRKLRGVEEVHVSFELGRVVVSFNDDLLDVEQIKRVIESLGYKVEKVDGGSKDVHLLILCWFSSLAIMVLMFWHNVYSSYFQLILAFLVQALGGYGFYKGAWSSLKAKVGNMDLLVALGSTSALLYSLLTLFGFVPGEPFFETSAFLITFVRTGKLLEELAKDRALKSLRDLFGLQTVRVRVIKDGREELRSLQEVFVGDVIVLRAGDMVPVDCKLLEGSLEVDESLITGESVPVKRSEGDRIISGSLVVSGFARARVEKTFGSSYVNLLVKLVEETLSKQPKIQRLADRFSHYFVQLVVALSLIVFVLWYLKTNSLPMAVNFSLAVLVISCPCAFGIAVPLALVMGVLRSQKKGLLIKDPSVFEKDVHVLVMDKTGTLTEGKPKLVSYALYREDALSLVCNMVKVSNHPYSLALREFCGDKRLEKVDIGACREEVGVGVICGEYVLRRGEEGQVALYENGSKLAEFFFEDVIRKGAKGVVEFLRSKGIEVIMLTGDRQDKARRVAEELGIKSFFAEVKPKEKLSKIREIKGRGLKVGMVGDGINDAPAMAEADLSFAIGSGTDVAKRVGHVILLKGIEGLKDFFDIKEKTMRRIWQNLFWAFFYNAIGIPIAGGLLYNKGIYLKPEIAGLMMAFSSLSVVLNSIRK
ncbi:MAG: heavy metal translocating P-type ATPase [Aquificaceae bacterium]